MLFPGWPWAYPTKDETAGYLEGVRRKDFAPQA
jgi:hypothetical protein